jgi:hypothetical protein
MAGLLGFFGGTSEALALERARIRAELGNVMLRWESAFPVRAAESKAGETAVPAWQGDYYAIAVYNLPVPLEPCERVVDSRSALLENASHRFQPPPRAPTRTELLVV